MWKVKLFFLVFALVGGMGGIFYVKNLQSQLVISEMNNAKLNEGIEMQKELLIQKENDFKAITEANNNLLLSNRQLEEDNQRLDQKFNKINASGKQRDIGNLAVQKPRSVEAILNKQAVERTRCFEIAQGSPLTEEETNATKKSQINSECTSQANPNYVGY